MNDKTVDLTRELARIAKEHQLTELEYKHKDTKIKLTIEENKSSDPNSGYAMPLMLPSTAFSNVPATAPVSAPTASPPATAPKKEISGEKILSPLAGVFYRAPEPGAPPFVEVGQEVQADQTLCIVEAMKLMNEIKAEVHCKITKILVKNEEAVAENQPIFIVEPL